MMTSDTGKTMSSKQRFLSLYLDNQREIERLDREIDLWRGRSVPEAYGIVKMLRGRLKDAAKLRFAIEQSIAGVSDKRLRLLLEYRYIDGMTWERIAELFNFDERWLLRLHKKALAQVEPR